MLRKRLRAWLALAGKAAGVPPPALSKQRCSHHLHPSTHTEAKTAFVQGNNTKKPRSEHKWSCLFSVVQHVSLYPKTGREQVSCGAYYKPSRLSHQRTQHANTRSNHLWLLLGNSHARAPPPTSHLVPHVSTQACLYNPFILLRYRSWQPAT